VDERELRVTHEELLFKLREADDWYGDQEVVKELHGYLKALLAVVELHKPHLFGIGEIICSGCSSGTEWTIDYPCETIQTIEEELK